VGIRKISLTIITVAFITIACSKIMPEEPASAEVLAGPVEELTPQQKANHLAGDAEFARIFAEADGLGPVFVSTSCESCHAGDGKGHQVTTLTRFCKSEGIYYNPLLEKGGPQLQHRSITGYTPESIPAEADGVTRLMAPPVTGLGYLEAVEDATILAMADPEDKDGDKISGVPSYIEVPDYFIPAYHHLPSGKKYIGRFGRKAGAVNLLQQTANAYVNDIGITSDFNMQDLFNPAGGIFTGDNVADPEIPASTVHNVAFYMRTLKAPVRRNTNDKDVIEGEKIFRNIGCDLCHKSELRTGRSDIEALSNKTFFPYTDLLLHDMGPELDDRYTEGSAATAEWRTTPLWGLGLSKDSQGGNASYLHDGRAKTLRQAVEFHGGEGAVSRENFRKLSQKEKDQLFKFLESL
jgi:CxxC motif-containing protein (DUF1111 family)